MPYHFNLALDNGVKPSEFSEIITHLAFHASFQKSPSKSRYQCYHFGMAQLLVRDLEEEVVQALRQRAAEEGTSVEEAHRRLLRSFLLHKKPSKTFKEALLEMPDDGDDSIFQRVERKPRKIVL